MKVTRTALLCLAMLLLLAGCRLFRKRASKPPEAHAEKQVSEAILQVITASAGDSIIEIHNYPLQTSELVRTFYTKRNYDPAWMTDRDAPVELMSILGNAASYGLDSTDYRITEVRKLMGIINETKDKEQKNRLFAQADLLLTDCYFRFASHVRHGRLDPKTMEPRIMASSDLAAHLEKALKKDDIKESIAALEPQQHDYVMLRKGLENYIANVKLHNDSISIPDPKEDSAACYAKVKEILITQSYLDPAQAQDDSLFVHALKKFQRQHGLNEDGRAGENTRQALSTSTYDRYKQAVINLERWRWQNESWGDRYVFVNIPAYHLKAYNKKDMLELRVIVGKPVTPTPELSDEIENMITNPFWHVPYSISSKELLPELRENPGEYFTKNRYKLFDSGNNPIDPTTVNWNEVSEKDFKYSMRQDAGDGNALGRIKFNFPNKHNVYLHDTPSRNLFVKETRSMSHGCVRVHTPIRLAEFLLAIQGGELTVSDVEELINKGTHKQIELKNKVPVHIRYFTAEGDKNGNIYFYRDVYKKDKALTEKLFKE
jgi:L,D-transpeptidase YcbB